jgi:hypothetical protein
MVFRITSKKKGMSTIELGNRSWRTTETALFKRKVQAVMNRDKNDKMNGDVHVDETVLIGGFSSAVGRSTETKDALMVAVEILLDGRTGNLSTKRT